MWVSKGYTSKYKFRCVFQFYAIPQWQANSFPMFFNSMLFPNGKQTLFQKKWFPNKSFRQAKGSLHKSPSIHPSSTQKPSEKRVIIQRNTGFWSGMVKVVGYCWWFRNPKTTTGCMMLKPGPWIMVDFNYRSLNWCLQPAGFQNHQQYIPLNLDILLTYQTFGPAKRKISTLTFRWIFCSGEELRATWRIIPVSN